MQCLSDYSDDWTRFTFGSTKLQPRCLAQPEYEVMKTDDGLGLPRGYAKGCKIDDVGLPRGLRCPTLDGM